MTYNEIKNEIKHLDPNDYTKALKLARLYDKAGYDLEPNARIAFIGSCSIQLIVSVTRMMLNKYGVLADVYEGEYNGINMDVFDDGSPLYRYAPKYLVILPDYRDVKVLPPVLSSMETVKERLQKVISYYLDIFNRIHEKLPSCQILCSNIVTPFERPMGNLECNYIFSTSSFFKLLNLEILKNKPSYVTLIDMEAVSDYVGKRNWFDETAYFLNKSSFSLKYIGLYADAIARQFYSLKGKARKCLVLDLDNTLWGGAVGDVGCDGIMLDSNDAVGEAYLAFQSYVLKLKERGVILAVCSKNDYENAKEPFDKNVNMILKYDDISCFVANWNDKVTNIRNIALTLNIGLDSLVFFDDNPTEREIVRTYLPEVYTVEVPDDPAYYVRALDEAAAFEWSQITKEDINRSGTYLDNKKRDELMLKYSDYEDYLKALCLEGQVASLEVKDVPRFSQLINKSNQFNLRTQRYSEAQIMAMLEDKDCDLLTVSLRDKFSNYGIIACVILKYIETDCFVDSWVMSCRVLKKDVEKLTFNGILRRVRDRGIRRIIGEYIPTQRNSMVKDLYESLGFQHLMGENGERQSLRFVLEQVDNKEINHNIKELS